MNGHQTLRLVAAVLTMGYCAAGVSQASKPGALPAWVNDVLTEPSSYREDPAVKRFLSGIQNSAERERRFNQALAARQVEALQVLDNSRIPRQRMIAMLRRSLLSPDGGVRSVAAYLALKNELWELRPEIQATLEQATAADAAYMLSALFLHDHSPVAADIAEAYLQHRLKHPEAHDDERSERQVLLLVARALLTSKKPSVSDLLVALAEQHPHNAVIWVALHRMRLDERVARLANHVLQDPTSPTEVKWAVSLTQPDRINAIVNPVIQRIVLILNAFPYSDNKTASHPARAQGENKDIAKGMDQLSIPLVVLSALPAATLEPRVDGLLSTKSVLTNVVAEALAIKLPAAVVAAIERHGGGPMFANALAIAVSADPNLEPRVRNLLKGGQYVEMLNRIKEDAHTLSATGARFVLRDSKGDDSE